MKISIREALELISNYSKSVTATETVSLFDACKRVLAQSVIADINQPPFDKSAMDGYACRKADVPGTLKLNSLIAAGTTSADTVHEGECIQILTGAKVPAGADCVIMQELTQTDADGNIVMLEAQNKSNICYQGEDVQAGQLLSVVGKRLSTADLPVLASAGVANPTVYRVPKVGIICTGSEIVDASETPDGAKIRNTNIYQLWAQIQQYGGEPTYYGIVPDEKESLLTACQQALEECDMLITTGGASVGVFDLIPQVFSELGAEIRFTGVTMQPGSPVLFASKGEKLLWGLSGNPVSSYLQFILLTRYSLARLGGEVIVEKRPIHTLSEPLVRHKKNRDLFVPVCMNDSGAVYPVKFNGSAHIAALTGIYGFACLPADCLRKEAGELVECIVL